MDSGQHAEGKQRGILGKFFGFLGTIALVVVCAWALRTFVIEPFQVPSPSMENTIMTGDMVFTEKVSYNFSDPKPGDIVVFSDPQIPSRTLIKRLIATEGQTVDLRNGVLYIDGVAQNEDYISGEPSYEMLTAGNVNITYPYTIPKGMAWVMGDNRTDSADSRYFGPIDIDTIFGKAVMIYWPFEHIGLI